MKKFKLLLLSAFISFPCVASDNVGAETKEDMRTERNTGYFVYASGGASLIVSELEGVWDSGALNGYQKRKSVSASCMTDISRVSRLL